MAPNSTNVAGSGTRSRRRPSRSGFSAALGALARFLPSVARRRSRIVRGASFFAGGAGWVGLSGAAGRVVVLPAAGGRVVVMRPIRQVAARTGSLAVEAVEALAALRSQTLAMYGSAAGVTQPVSPWSTIDDPDPAARGLRRGPQRLVPGADRDQRPVHAVPGAVARAGDAGLDPVEEPLEDNVLEVRIVERELRVQVPAGL